VIRAKVDENLPEEFAAALRRAGHDACSVREQNMGGSPDADLAATCLREGRALFTLDLDFAGIRAYPPADYSGLVVLRVRSQARAHVLEVLQSLLSVLPDETLPGRLWIVEDGRVRISEEPH
jgi:predicted nuclease of predicted toxin-antitoxin system